MKMKTKTLTPAQTKKLRLKREKEIRKWEKEKARPKRNYYFAYLVLIICIIYATDEIASQIGTLMKTEIANDLFSKFGESSVGLLDILSILVVPFQALGLLYRPLADKWGRKKFLIINTFGMSFAMLVIFLSGNLVMYFVGACMVQFFIPHDMHVVYIMESSPSKHRARIYSVIKFFANMAVMLVPLLRRLLMAEASQWRNVYLIPAFVGIATSLIALLFAREPDTFIDSRLRYLNMSDEERAAEEQQKKTENAQGGLIPALKFAMKHRQLKWLYITSAIANLGFIGTIDYQVIMTYGYAENFLGKGLFENLEAALEAVSIGSVTTALFMFPAHNEPASTIKYVQKMVKGVYLLNWKEEVQAFIDGGGNKWDFCYDDQHLHSTPLAGYIGAHMIYRAIYGEIPQGSVNQIVLQSEVDRILGNYSETGIIYSVKSDNLYFFDK